LGNIVRQGAQGGAMAYGGAQGMNTGTAAGSLPGQAASSAAPGSVSVGGVSMAAPQAAAMPSLGSPAASSMLSQLGHGAASAASNFGSFAKANPMAIGAGLQGLGSMSQSGSENRLRNAQAGQLEQNTAFEADMKKRREAALAPLYQAFLGQQQGVARNPYNPFG
jgi:hypothetical protein